MKDESAETEGAQGARVCNDPDVCLLRHTVYIYSVRYNASAPACDCNATVAIYSSSSTENRFVLARWASRSSSIVCVCVRTGRTSTTQPPNSLLSSPFVTIADGSVAIAIRSDQQQLSFHL